MIDHYVHGAMVSFGPRGAASPRMKTLHCAGHIATAAVFLLSAPRVFAADAPTKASDLGDSSSIVCLSNTTKDAERRPFVIAVAPQKAEELLARGFVQTKCAETKRASNAKQVANKKRAASDRQVGSEKQAAGEKQVGSDQNLGICEMARARDPLVNLYFWQRFSLTPEEMCQATDPSSSVPMDSP